MWARDFEFFIGIWIAISWLVFDYRGPAHLVINDIICCLLIMFFALASYTKKFGHIHLFNFVMGIWLICFHFFFDIPFAASQNYIVLGLLLLMFSLVPSHAERPPVAWIEFMRARENRKKK